MYEVSKNTLKVYSNIFKFQCIKHLKFIISRYKVFQIKRTQIGTFKEKHEFVSNSIQYNLNKEDMTTIKRYTYAK